MPSFSGRAGTVAGDFWAGQPGVVGETRISTNTILHTAAVVRSVTQARALDILLAPTADVQVRQGHTRELAWSAPSSASVAIVHGLVRDSIASTGLSPSLSRQVAL